MNTASRLIEEFESVAQTVRSSPHANAVMPGVMVVHNSPLNSYRNSVADARISYGERAASPRFLDRVDRLNLRETSRNTGMTVTQEWNYERNGQSESFVFVREIEETRVRETAVLRCKAGRQEFDFQRCTW